MRWLPGWVAAGLALVLSTAAQAVAGLPPEAQAALQHAGVPADALAVVVLDASNGRRVLQWQEIKPLNPA